MTSINFTASNSTPSVRFGDDGKLVIKGKSISENDTGFYQPLIDWACMLQINVLIVDIDLEYMNSTSSKKLFYLLRVLDSNDNIKKLIVNWYYEEGDEDTLTKGQVFDESLPKVEFRFHLNPDAYPNPV